MMKEPNSIYVENLYLNLFDDKLNEIKTVLKQNDIDLVRPGCKLV